MKKKHNKLNEHNSSITTVILFNDKKVKLTNEINSVPLTYKERVEEVQSKILNDNDNIIDFETYWLGIKNQNGQWSEKVKSCLDVITTYLLRAPDSGIKDVVLH